MRGHIIKSVARENLKTWGMMAWSLDRFKQTIIFLFALKLVLGDKFEANGLEMRAEMVRRFTFILFESI